MIRIPTGGRQISWLFTRMTEGLNQALNPEQHQLVARAGFEPIEIQRPNHALGHPASLEMKNDPRRCERHL